MVNRSPKPTFSLQQFWQRWETIPQPPVEDSLLLRILVQSLVIVGVIATDVAAETYMSVWAIPLSIGGSTWSWYRRRERNIAAKFAISIGMMAALVFFLGNLLVNLNDTRLALVQLLVQLQVLHSFDLPRRKDLGYSMVIGLILIGVAGTVSQTLAFAPWLVVFLAIAIPTLILDYRSRLGLEKIEIGSRRSGKAMRRLPSRFSPLSPRQLFVFVAIVIALGLVIFAFMPRFPGYKLQSFPVSGSAEMQDRRFDDENRDIVNPGYVREGRAGNNGQGGTIPEEGAGQVDPAFYYGFNSKMNQNLRGEMEPQVVMRVRSQSPGFWQVMSFDRYTGQGWEMSRDDQLQNLQRGDWSYRFYIPSIPHRGAIKQVIQSYTAVSDLPNIIPALSYPRYVFFPTKEIAIDSEGNLRSPAGLSQGMTYTVISQVPYRDRTRLGTVPPVYNKQIQDYYLQIPPQIKEKIRQKAEAILAKSPNHLTSAYEKALFLAQYLKQNYQLQPEMPFLDDKEDLVSAFLFRYQGGYPDHFSSVLTVMLRSLGIPARLTVGFDSGEFNPFTGYYIVRNTDAYALTEVYFPYYGWFAFNPIPGHELIPPSFEEDQTFSVLKQLWNWVAGWLPSPVTSLLGILWNSVIGGLLGIFARMWRFISGSLIGFLLGVICAIAIAFLGWLGFRWAGSLGKRRSLAKLPPMERLYRLMLEELSVKGYPKHPAQTPLEYARLTSHNYSTAAAEIVEEISLAYVRWRYDSQTQNLDYLRQQYKRLSRSLKTGDRSQETEVRRQETGVRSQF